MSDINKDITVIEEKLKSLAIEITIMENKRLCDWSDIECKLYNYTCEQYGNNLDVYADYCDNNPLYTPKFNY